MSIKKSILIAFCIGIVLVGGVLALLANMHMRQSAYAAPNLPQGDLSVVGPPSLPASTVDSIFAHLGSPMAGSGALVEQTSRQVNIDDAFALAAWWTETNDGEAGVGVADRNPGSVRGSIGYPSAYDGYTIYPNYADAIVYWFHMLKNIYIGRGLTTVYAISHPYVGTSTSYLWAGKVVALMLRYRGEAPPPTPSPSPAPIPPARARHIAPPVNTGATSTGIQSSVSSTSDHESPLHTASTIQQAQQYKALSAAATWLIAAFALLLALVIALWAGFILGRLPVSAWFIGDQGERKGRPYHTRREKQQHPIVSGIFPAPNTDALSTHFAFQSPTFRLPSRSLVEPQTGALLGTQFIASGSFSSSYYASDLTTSTSLVATPASTMPGAFLPPASKLRRTQLRPASHTPEQLQEVPVSVGGRPTGLLARYGNISKS